MVGAAEAADMLLQERMDRFSDLRRDGDAPAADDRKAFGEELGRSKDISGTLSTVP